jgi:formate dehydrogenase subunit gamma
MEVVVSDSESTAAPELSAAEQLAATVLAFAVARRNEPGALLPILHDILREFGYIDPVCVSILAEELNLSRADVHGVVTFYRDFRQTPPGRTTVKLCGAEACQSVGSRELAVHAQTVLGVAFGETTVDGAVTLDQVFCLGNCALGPSVQIGDRLVGRVDAARFDSLVYAARP